MGRFELLLRSGFTAAHHLKMPDGAWEPLHSHDWRVEVFVSGDRLDGSGMVADFTVLQRDLSRITDELNEACLNELPALAHQNPSTEHVAKLLHDWFAPTLAANVRVTMVRVWETRECAAAYIPEPTEKGGQG